MKLRLNLESSFHQDPSARLKLFFAKNSNPGKKLEGEKFGGNSKSEVCIRRRNATLFTCEGSDFASKLTSYAKFVPFLGSTCNRDFLFLLIASYRLLVRFQYLVQPTNQWSLLDQL
jgi:hypothetical protein